MLLVRVIIIWSVAGQGFQTTEWPAVENFSEKIERAYTIQNILYRWRTALGFLFLMFVLFFVFGRLFVFNWSTFPLAASERKFLNTWTWQPYLKKLNWIRRLVLCDWNCVVTFHQRSCLIPYPIDGKVSRHQFLPHHFPGLLRVWG